MRDIYGFYHICLINDWRDIVKAQINKIKQSNLLIDTKKLYITILGKNEEVFEYIDLLPKDKVSFEYCRDIELYEFPTLKKIKKLAKRDNFYCWYVHTKGTAFNENNMSFYHGATDINHLKNCVKDWRELMEYFIIDKYKIAINCLDDYDAYGVNLVELPQLHFSGNFWWAKSEYISKLPEIEEIDSDRWQAELWIGLGNGKLKCVYDYPQAGYSERLSLKYREII